MRKYSGSRGLAQLGFALGLSTILGTQVALAAGGAGAVATAPVKTVAKVVTSVEMIEALSVENEAMAQAALKTLYGNGEIAETVWIAGAQLIHKAAYVDKTVDLGKLKEWAAKPENQLQPSRLTKYAAEMAGKNQSITTASLQDYAASYGSQAKQARAVVDINSAIPGPRPIGGDGASALDTKFRAYARAQTFKDEPTVQALFDDNAYAEGEQATEVREVVGGILAAYEGTCKGVTMPEGAPACQTVARGALVNTLKNITIKTIMATGSSLKSHGRFVTRLFSKYLGLAANAAGILLGQFNIALGYADAAYASAHPQVHKCENGEAEDASEVGG